MTSSLLMLPSVRETGARPGDGRVAHLANAQHGDQHGGARSGGQANDADALGSRLRRHAGKAACLVCAPPAPPACRLSSETTLHLKPTRHLRRKNRAGQLPGGIRLGHAALFSRETWPAVSTKSQASRGAGVPFSRGLPARIYVEHDCNTLGKEACRATS